MVSPCVMKTGLRAVMMCGLMVLAACSDPDPQFAPSGAAVSPPSTDISFDEYVRTTRQQIRDVLNRTRFSAEEKPFGASDIDQVVEMRAPYAISPDSESCEIGKSALAPSKGQAVGFLMVHGLTDSPYWLSNIRNDLRTRFPCATFHGVLLPGHGTVPGDLMDVTYQDWLETVRFGMDSFGSGIDHIIPVGYSTGAALIGHIYHEEDNAKRISAMIMLSPGLAAKSAQAWLTPYARYVQNWVGQGSEHDPAKYGSMAMNAAAEFYLLTNPFATNDLPEFDVPVFGVVSSDDQTINPGLVRDFICQKVTAPQKHLIWYQGEIPPPGDSANCQAIDQVTSKTIEMRTLNHAHTAITMSPTDPFYGLDGSVPDCGHYDENSARSHCQTGTDILYGERNLFDTAPNGTLRRGTFNPDFAGMMDKMATFITTALTEND